MKFKHSMSNIWKVDFEDDEEDMVVFIEEDDDKSLKDESESQKKSDHNSILPNSSTTKLSKTSLIVDKQPSSEVELATTVIGPKLSRTKNVTVVGADGTIADASASGDSDDSSSSLLGLHIRHEKRSLANLVS